MFLSMYTVDRDYDQFFKGKSSLMRNLILMNLLIFTRLKSDPCQRFTNKVHGFSYVGKFTSC